MRFVHTLDHVQTYEGREMKKNTSPLVGPRYKIEVIYHTYTRRITNTP